MGQLEDPGEGLLDGVEELVPLVHDQVQGRVLPRLAALEASLMILAQPMMTVLWAQLLFDEDLSRLQWMGVALVLVGLVVGLARRAEVLPREPVTTT